MKKIDFCEAFGEISEALVRDAHAAASKAKKPAWMKWGAVAACLCLVIVGAIALFPEQRTNTPVYGVLAEVTEISDDNQFEAVVTGEDKNFSKNDAVTVTYESAGGIVFGVGDTLAITYSKFEKTQGSYEISAGQIEIVSACGQQSGASEVIEFHGAQFNKADLSKETLDWLAQYNSLSPEEQLAISSVPADLYTYDNAGTAGEIAGE